MAEASDDLVAPLPVVRRLEDWNDDVGVSNNADTIWHNRETLEREADIAARETKMIQTKLEKLISAREELRERLDRDATSAEKMSSTNRREAEKPEEKMDAEHDHLGNRQIIQCQGGKGRPPTDGARHKGDSAHAAAGQPSPVRQPGNEGRSGGRGT